MIAERTPAETLRAWAKAYREGPASLRFPSDPNAEFFPVDMEAAADEIERLYKMRDGLVEVLRAVNPYSKMTDA